MESGCTSPHGGADHLPCGVRVAVIRCKSFAASGEVELSPRDGGCFSVEEARGCKKDPGGGCVCVMDPHGPAGHGILCLTTSRGPPSGFWSLCRRLAAMRDKLPRLSSGIRGPVCRSSWYASHPGVGRVPGSAPCSCPCPASALQKARHLDLLREGGSNCRCPWGAGRRVHVVVKGLCGGGSGVGCLVESRILVEGHRQHQARRCRHIRSLHSGRHAGVRCDTGHRKCMGRRSGRVWICPAL